VDRRFMATIAEDFAALNDERAAGFVAKERKLARSQNRHETWLLLIMLTFTGIMLWATVWSYADGNDWWWSPLGIGVLMAWRTKVEADRAYHAAEHRRMMLDTLDHMLDSRPK